MSKFDIEFKPGISSTTDLKYQDDNIKNSIVLNYEIPVGLQDNNVNNDIVKNQNSTAKE